MAAAHRTVRPGPLGPQESGSWRALPFDDTSALLQHPQSRDPLLPVWDNCAQLFLAEEESVEGERERPRLSRFQFGRGLVGALSRTSDTRVCLNALHLVSVCLRLIANACHAEIGLATIMEVRWLCKPFDWFSPCMECFSVLLAGISPLITRLRSKPKSGCLWVNDDPDKEDVDRQRIAVPNLHLIVLARPLTFLGKKSTTPPDNRQTRATTSRCELDLPHSNCQRLTEGWAELVSRNARACGRIYLF